MTATLDIPQLTGGRRRAAALIGSAHLPSNLSGQTIVMDCRQLRAGTESFADEFVRTVLVDRGADRLEVANVSGQFADYLRAAGRTHAVSNRLIIGKSDHALAH